MASQAKPAAPTVNRVGMSSDWHIVLLRLGMLTTLILALFWRDAADMFGIWWQVSTYNHILFVLPIIGWLVAMRYDQLRQLIPAPWIGGALIVGAGAALWLMGYAAGISAARHLALVLMLQGSVVGLLGKQVSRGLVFPLCYAFFLVPMGDEIVPLLQTITTKLSMVFLGWSGIPAHIEGIFISTPTGYFRVAEACSGIQFLVAMIAYGALVAHLCFTRWSRRALFLVVCVVVPVFANGVRAWGTMYIAHQTSNDFASGFDHILYGWFFFAIVLALVMGLGWKFFDRKYDDPMIDADALHARYPKGSETAYARWVLPLIAGLVVLPFIWAQLATLNAAQLPSDIAPPDVPGWQRTGTSPSADWQPVQKGADRTFLASYRNQDGQVVDLYVALYSGQEEGREMVGYGQGAYDPESDWSWTSQGQPVAGGRSDVLAAPGPVLRDALTFYRYGDLLTGSPVAVKIETVKARLFARAQPAIVVIVSAERDGEESARVAIDDFLGDLGPVDKFADRLAGIR